MALPVIRPPNVQSRAGDTASYNLRQYGHKATIGGTGCNIVIDPETKGKCGYLVAKRKRTGEGVKRSFPQVHYLPSPGSKTYTVRVLNNGDSVNISGVNLEYRF